MITTISALEQRYEPFVLSPNWERPPQVACKRVLDILTSALSLILLAPLFVVLGILVKLTSPGPVFYRWKVVGKDGSPFTGYKFRSMVMDADELKTRLKDQN